MLVALYCPIDPRGGELLPRQWRDDYQTIVAEDVHNGSKIYMPVLETAFAEMPEAVYGIASDRLAAAGAVIS